MLDKKNTHRTHPSLLPLRMTLTAAESRVPSQPMRKMSIDEQRALDLIKMMRTEYNKPLLFANFIHMNPKSLTLGASNTNAFRINFKEVIESNV